VLCRGNYNYGRTKKKDEKYRMREGAMAMKKHIKIGQYRKGCKESRLSHTHTTHYKHGKRDNEMYQRFWHLVTPIDIIVPNPTVGITAFPIIPF